MNKIESLKTQLQYIGNIFDHSQYHYDYIPLSKFKILRNDFQTDFTVFHGPIVRDGAYKYYDKNGRKITLYKDWDNLKDIYSRYDYLPIKGSIEEGAHYGQEFGFGFNFIPNEETHEIEADLVSIENIEKLTPLLNPKGGYHVSPGYHDLIKGELQIILDLDHIAFSLANEDVSRACTGMNEKGASCTTVNIVKNYDQNLNTEVVN